MSLWTARSQIDKPKRVVAGDDRIERDAVGIAASDTIYPIARVPTPWQCIKLKHLSVVSGGTERRIWENRSLLMITTSGSETAALILIQYPQGPSALHLGLRSGSWDVHSVSQQVRCPAQRVSSWFPCKGGSRSQNVDMRNNATMNDIAQTTAMIQHSIPHNHLS